MKQRSHMTFQYQPVLWSFLKLCISQILEILWLLSMDLVSLSYGWIIHSKAHLKNKKYYLKLLNSDQKINSSLANTPAALEEIK